MWHPFSLNGQEYFQLFQMAMHHNDGRRKNSPKTKGTDTEKITKITLINHSFFDDINRPRKFIILSNQ